jgi:hypothetical protein
MTSAGMCIHHPKGDIKKISKWEKAISLQADYWKVKYSKGSTEGGSSGSPLFNRTGYVVGQLSHGNASCSNTGTGLFDGHDFFGCFHRSWEKYGLCYELNPNGDHSGSYQYYISRMGGNEPCRQNWIFNNCKDLHTSNNVTYLSSSTLGTRQYDGVYNASNQITAENTTIQAGTKVVFEAGNKVVLKPGFRAVAGCNFRAGIAECLSGCNNGNKSNDGDFDYEIYENNEVVPKNSIMNADIAGNNDIIQGFAIYPNPNNGVFSINLFDENLKINKIMITDIRGFVIYSTNTFTTDIQLSNPVSGIYFISLYFSNKVLTSKLTIL